MKTLVIGFGNPLRRDDGVGPFVVGLLEPSADLEVIACHQLTPEMAEAVSRAGRVIFIDARADLAPGEIAIEPVHPHASALFHQFDPGTLLACAAQLYGAAPEAFLAGVGAESFELGETLSPAVEAAARKLPGMLNILAGL